jgi:hypothetical protein
LPRSFLAPTPEHLAGAFVRSFAEIFEGDAPHIAAEWFAQARGVAEILRAWIELERQRTRP